MSVRNYAILYPRLRTRTATAGGGNSLLATGQHALSGPEHTGQLPIERISTDEIDTTLVVVPDGAGGLTFGTAGGSLVPYYIAPGETFAVPEFKQALFSMLIDNEGTLAVDGFLLEVD